MGKQVAGIFSYNTRRWTLLPREFHRVGNSPYVGEGFISWAAKTPKQNNNDNKEEEEHKEEEEDID